MTLWDGSVCVWVCCSLIRQRLLVWSLFLPCHVFFLALRLAFLAAGVLDTNCCPARDPAAFLRFVAAFCAGVRFFHASSGRYLLVPPLRWAGLPSLVRQFCLPHCSRDFCDFFLAVTCSRHL